MEESIQIIKNCYLECKFKSEHAGEIITMVCCDPNCPKNIQFTPMCALCIEENIHNTDNHKEKSLKRFLKEIEQIQQNISSDKNFRQETNQNKQENQKQIEQVSEKLGVLGKEYQILSDKYKSISENIFQYRQKLININNTDETQETQNISNFIQQIEYSDDYENLKKNLQSLQQNVQITLNQTTKKPELKIQKQQQFLYESKEPQIYLQQLNKNLKQVQNQSTQIIQFFNRQQNKNNDSIDNKLLCYQGDVPELLQLLLDKYKLKLLEQGTLKSIRIQQPQQDKLHVNDDQSNYINSASEYDQKIYDLSLEIEDFIQNKLQLNNDLVKDYKPFINGVIKEEKFKDFPINIDVVQRKVIFKYLQFISEILEKNINNYVDNEELFASQWLRIIEPFYLKFKDQNSDRITNISNLFLMYLDLIQIFKNLQEQDDESQQNQIEEQNLILEELNKAVEIIQESNTNDVTNNDSKQKVNISKYDNLRIIQNMPQLQQIFTISVFQNKRILLLGLDASGKTSLLYKLKLDENINTIPTIGFNVENVYINNKQLDIWDVGGSSKIRTLWKHYFENVQGVIYTVSLSDTDRLQETKTVLEYQLQNGLQNNKHISLIILGTIGENNQRNVTHEEFINTFSFLNQYSSFLTWNIKEVQVQSQSKKEIKQILLPFTQQLR